MNMLNARALLAEFIGTFALIFVGVLVIFHLGQAEAGLIGIALAHGLAIACFVSATAAISGGHLNPAVSLGFLVAKRIDFGTFVGYVLAQLAGACVAALLVMPMVPGNAREILWNGTPQPGHYVTFGGALLAEVVTTFFLMFVIFGTAVDRRAPKMAGLFIGLTVTLGIFAVGPTTGGAMNPARWFGPALVSGHPADNAAIYILGGETRVRHHGRGLLVRHLHGRHDSSNSGLVHDPADQPPDNPHPPLRLRY